MLTLRVNTQCQHVPKGLDLYLRVNALVRLWTFIYVITLRVVLQCQHVSKGLDLYLHVNIAFQKVEQEVTVVVMEVVLD